MTTSAIDLFPAGAMTIEVTENTLTAQLSDGRTISIPLVWYPRLVHGTPEERDNWELRASGQHLHWPDLDEDISVDALLAGQGSRESLRSLKRWLGAKEAGRGLTWPELTAADDDLLSLHSRALGDAAEAEAQRPQSPVQTEVPHRSDTARVPAINNDDEYLARHLNESIARFINWISSWELDADTGQGAMSRDERIEFERWVRFDLTTRLIPDVLATACGVLVHDSDAINDKLPDLIKKALTPVPTNVEFMQEIMARLPDDERTRRISELPGQGVDLPEIAVSEFQLALYHTMALEIAPDL